MSEGSDEVKNETTTRPFDSDREDELVIDEFRKNRRRKGIKEQHSSSVKEDTKDNKRKKIGETYIQKVRKIKRNTGKSYYTQTGNIVPAKVFQNVDCYCRKGCIKNYEEEERKNHFDKFWHLGDFNKQNILLYESTERYSVKRKREKNGNGTPRNYSFRYLLNSKKGKIAVCKKFFLDTFKISEGRLKRVLNSDNVGNDLRGRTIGSSRKISEEEKKHVLKHIESFIKFESHYAGSNNSDKRYLRPDLTLKKMFNLYELHCKENNIKAVNEWTYRKIFKQDFDLQLHQTRKDTYQKSDLLNIKIKPSDDNEEKNKLVEVQDTCLRIAELARKSLKQDQEMASRNSDHFFAFSLDFESLPRTQNVDDQ